MKEVRTRFAPSPTGPLHVGGLRTALFGWLYARHHGGKFILRIEDTDQSRLVPGAADKLMSALKWFSLDWDEGPNKGGTFGPYIQSERLDIYRGYLMELVDKDAVYPCFCEPQERGTGGYDLHCRNLSDVARAALMQSNAPHTWRFKMPLDGTTEVDDMVLGHLSFPNVQTIDPVLLKRDGFPTYHLAHVVDDHLMNITHVTRANEWLPSLPLHVQMWKAFDWLMPEYAHLPVLLNPNGKGKLSKRHLGYVEDGKSVPIVPEDFRDQGFLPEAVLNFLCNVGWNFGNDREIFSIQEAIERFDLKDVHQNNSLYPVEKLEWINSEYIKAMEPKVLAQRLRAPLTNAGLDPETTPEWGDLEDVAKLVQTRLKSLNDIVWLAGFFFAEDVPMPPVEDMKDLGVNAVLADMIADAVSKTDMPLMAADLEKHLREFCALVNIKPTKIFNYLRVVITGQLLAPPLFETCQILGYDYVIHRLLDAARALESSA